MGRQRLSGRASVKVSLLLPPELHRQVEDLVARRKWDKSHVLRHLIELGLVAERQQASPAVPQPTTQERGGQGRQDLTVGLTAELLSCIDLAARLHGLEPAALIRQMVDEQIATYIAKGRERQEELRRLIEEERQGH